MGDELGTLVAKLAADITDLKKGLFEGRQQLASFQSVVESAGAKINQALAFAGISLGLYEVISKIKEFGASVLEAGGKAEVLRAAMYAIGQHYQISAASLDIYVKKLTEMGVSQENALQSINNFLKAGLSVDLLPQLAAAAKDLAPTMAMPFNEAFQSIIQSITKGTPKALAELTPGIKQAMQAASTETKKLMDATVQSGTEKAQIMVDFVLAAGQKVEGAGAAMTGTYLKQLNEYKRTVREVKEALFEVVKPISMAITGQEIKSWQDVYAWIVNNKQALRDLAEVLVVYVERIANAMRVAVNFISTHKDMAKTLLTIYLISKTVGWFTGIVAGAAVAGAAAVTLTGKLTALLALCGGPYKVTITLALFNLYEAHKAIQALRAEAGFTPRPLQMAGAIQEGRARDRAAMDMKTSGANLGAEAERRGVSPEALEALIKENTRLRAEGKAMKALPTVLAQHETPEERAAREAAAAAAEGRKENALAPGAAKGGKGGGAQETIDNLLAPMLAMYKAKREADLADAQNSLDLLKTTNDQKRAILEKELAEELIDGQTYYQRLQELQQQETDAAVAMIGKKREAQQKAYKDSLTEIEADTKLSVEAKNIARQKMEADNRKALAKLDTEATQARLEGEKRVTEELTKQLETKRQYTQKTEDFNIETAQLLGAISEQEATLQKLVLDWQRTKAEALKVPGGVDPAFFTAGAANLEAKKANTLYGGYASQITQGISSLTDALMSGGRDLKAAANSMFKGLFNEALKPGLKQLEQLMANGFKDLFGAAGAGIASAVMGAIGLIGMMLTSGGSSTFTSSGVQSGVTGHEAIRGVIAGETSIPIAQIGVSLAEAVSPHLKELRQINANTRTGGGGRGASYEVDVKITDLQAVVQEAISRYFAKELMQGA